MPSQYIQPMHRVYRRASAYSKMWKSNTAVFISRLYKPVAYSSNSTVVTMESRNTQYQAVSTTEDQEKLLQTTQFPPSFTEKWHTTESVTDGSLRRRKGLRSYLWFFDTALLLVIASLLLLLVLRDQWREMRTSSPRQVGSEYSGTEPEFSTRVVKWEADFSFVPKNTTEFFSDHTLSRWQTIMPAGTGFGEAGQPFSTTSMTHQLHCLVRKGSRPKYYACGIQTPLTERTQFMMGRIYAGVTTDKTETLPSDYHNHFLHCIDYLRQAVMCAGDMALELHDPSDTDDLGPTDGGWNGHHVCKDYSQILGYLEDQISEGVRIVLPIDD
ncbi:hypothetical protein F5Y18DRAFT_260633 [Xylariaceae sp. FL1019]|nr:hypothetical protein F5Y18DRAFT_260633 [Xylariaceae sp. FL1019]